MAEVEGSDRDESGSSAAHAEGHHDLYGALYYDNYEGLRTDGTGPAPVPYRWGERVWEDFFGNIAGEVVDRLHPQTVLDAGCAVGFLVKSLRDRGVDAEGFDYSAWAISQVHPDARPFCWEGSVTDELSRDYDLITCIEVLEHVTPDEANTAVSNFCRHSRAVLFSSTPDHFDEVTHINVRLPDYWVGLFARHGFYRDLDFDTGFVSSDAILFHPMRHWEQVVKSYERQFGTFQRELRGLRSHRDYLYAELQRQLGSRDELQALMNTRTYRLRARARAILAKSGAIKAKILPSK